MRDLSVWSERKKGQVVRSVMKEEVARFRYGQDVRP